MTDDLCTHVEGGMRCTLDPGHIGKCLPFMPYDGDPLPRRASPGSPLPEPDEDARLTALEQAVAALTARLDELDTPTHPIPAQPHTQRVVRRSQQL